MTESAISADKMVFMIILRFLVSEPLLEVVAVDLLVEGLGIERAGRAGNTGDNGKREECGKGGLHGCSPVFPGPARGRPRGRYGTVFAVQKGVSRTRDEQ